MQQLNSTMFSPARAEYQNIAQMINLTATLLHVTVCIYVYTQKDIQFSLCLACDTVFLSVGKNFFKHSPSTQILISVHWIFSAFAPQI